MDVLHLHTHDVSAEQVKAVESGIEIVGVQVPKLEGLNVVISQEFNADSAPMLNSRQVDGSAILDGFPDWPNRGILVVTIGKDLGHRAVNYLFGLSNFNRGKAIFSTYRLNDQPAAIVGLVAHELGHSVGLVGAHARNYDRISQCAGHCANPCIMEPANNPAEMLNAARRIMGRPAQSGFCDDCVSTLRNTEF